MAIHFVLVSVLGSEHAEHNRYALTIDIGCPTSLWLGSLCLHSPFGNFRLVHLYKFARCLVAYTDRLLLRVIILVHLYIGDMNLCPNLFVFLICQEVEDSGVLWKVVAYSCFCNICMMAFIQKQKSGQ